MHKTLKVYMHRERYVRTSHTGLYFICLGVYRSLKNLVSLVGGFHILEKYTRMFDISLKCICINMPLFNQDIEVKWVMLHNMTYFHSIQCV